MFVCLPLILQQVSLSCVLLTLSEKSAGIYLQDLLQFWAEAVTEIQDEVQSVILSFL